MMYPNYRIDGSTRYILFQLVQKCLDLNLENFSFCYDQEGVYFYLTEHEDYWQLEIKQPDAGTTDLFQIQDDSISYKGSTRKE
ncbi:hypothetical protein NVS47_06280 [Dehalobacterium formicoaceticum]|uniref:Uncharacterized protein n=1 Tax=Dehalobacterium formicoaceticum TaxID=51515 RepID=A0ABT1Y4Q9_9FIRM|nr:hypothetical protein [Dehalobacterium formicoaceticum]MCR6545125.1 hypothetical protein [Dehalobacterium formicoaceticum]